MRLLHVTGCKYKLHLQDKICSELIPKFCVWGIYFEIFGIMCNVPRHLLLDEAKQYGSWLKQWMALQVCSPTSAIGTCHKPADSNSQSQTVFHKIHFNIIISVAPTAVCFLSSPLPLQKKKERWTILKWLTFSLHSDLLVQFRLMHSGLLSENFQRRDQFVISTYVEG